MSKTERISGTIIRGLGVASGQRAVETGKPEYERGTIYMQRAAMRQDKFNKADYFEFGDLLKNMNIYNGTINIQLKDNLFLYKSKATKFVKDLYWDDACTESFYYYAVIVEFKNSYYKGFIYRPARSKLAAHKSDIVEVLAPKIPGLSYEDKISIHVRTEHIKKLTIFETAAILYGEKTEKEVFKDAA